MCTRRPALCLIFPHVPFSRYPLSSPPRSDAGIFITAPVSTVSGSHNEYHLSSFSSRGPTRDGRLKPDVVAPGEFIISSRSDGNLTSFQCSADDGSTLRPMQGTSMAAPVAAGTAMLAREYLMKGYYPTGRLTAPNGVQELTAPAYRGVFPGAAEAPVGASTSATGLRASSPDAFVPSAALLKGLLLHSSVPVGGPVKTAERDSKFEAVHPPPSLHQGYGRLKLNNVLTIAGDNPSYLPRAGGIADERRAAPAVFLVDHTSSWWITRGIALGPRPLRAGPRAALRRARGSPTSTASTRPSSSPPRTPEPKTPRLRTSLRGWARSRGTRMRIRPRLCPTRAPRSPTATTLLRCSPRSTSSTTSTSPSFSRRPPPATQACLRGRRRRRYWASMVRATSPTSGCVCLWATRPPLRLSPPAGTTA